MRMLLLAATTAMACSAMPANAQYASAPVAPHSGPAPHWQGGPQGQWRGGAGGWQGGRWGGQIAGRWWGGTRAPGGWRAYRRPVRGWVLPSYWVAPGWYVGNWSTYGLPQPPYGYTWSRYYDDAVLIDQRGMVYDSVPGVAWDRYDGYAGGNDGRGGDGYPRLPYPTRDADNGVGGAVIGGVVGGVAGNVIAGRGNRLGGTLLGAGAGALAGMAIDRSDRAGRVPVAPPPGADRGGYGGGYGAPYAPPGPGPGPGADYPPPAPVVAYQSGSYGGDYAGTTYSGTTYYGPAPAPVAPPRPVAPPPPLAGYGAPGTIVTGDGTIVTTSSTQASAGYVAGGWYYPGTTVTTVTVQSGGAGAAQVIEEDVYDRGVAYKGRRYTKGGCRC